MGRYAVSPDALEGVKNYEEHVIPVVKKEKRPCKRYSVRDAQLKYNYRITQEGKMSIETKITSLELENIKRIKAVQITPTSSGLTIVGGKNNQGKTSVLDAIMWILGGDRYRPSEPHREGSVTPPYGKITLSNGLVVERKGKNSDLKVIDPSR